MGAGISGLSAAWLLAKTHEVHLFESAPRLGGHAHTVDIAENGSKIPIDTGFLVYNELTYPNLCGFFDALNVETCDSDMSLSIRLPQKNLEWSGTNLNSVFGQRQNLVRPGFYKMLNEIMRFAREAEMNLKSSRENKWSLGQLLTARAYSKSFWHDYLIPAGAAIWSTPETEMLDFPGETFLTFFMNHRLLEVSGRPTWRTVKNGSRNYVEKAARTITHVHTSAPVVRIERRDGKIALTTPQEQMTFDRVVMATHAPVTNRILSNQSEIERRVLSAFSTEPNQAVLHRDNLQMPIRKVCWASWNVRGTHGLESEEKAQLTYYINRLQPLPTSTDYFVSLNPTGKISNVLDSFDYDHPKFNRSAIDAQGELPSIQGAGGVYYAGAWSRYGFHEDGILSAVRVAKLFGIEPPWAAR